MRWALPNSLFKIAIELYMLLALIEFFNYLAIPPDTDFPEEWIKTVWHKLTNFRDDLFTLNNRQLRGRKFRLKLP